MCESLVLDGCSFCLCVFPVVFVLFDLWFLFCFVPYLFGRDPVDDAIVTSATRRDRLLKQVEELQRGGRGGGSSINSSSSGTGGASLPAAGAGGGA